MKSITIKKKRKIKSKSVSNEFEVFYFPQVTEDPLSNPDPL